MDLGGDDSLFKKAGPQLGLVGTWWSGFPIVIAKFCGRGMFGIRVKTGHKNPAEDLRVIKTTLCMVSQVDVHSPRSSICVEAGVRKRFRPSVIPQTVFTCIRQNKSSVRAGLLFWTDFPMTGNYTYPEHTPLSVSHPLFDRL